MKSGSVNKIFKIWYYVAGLINLTACLLFSLVKLLRHYGVLKKAEIVVNMPKGGFGHTITGPDTARRLFASKRCVFIIFSVFNSHNWKTSLIWPDIDVIFLPLSVGLKTPFGAFSLPCLYWDNIRPARLILLFLRAVNNAFDFYDIWEMHGMTPVPDYIKTPGPDLSHLDDDIEKFSYACTIGYFRLLDRSKAPKVRLPPKQREIIIDKLGAGRNKKLCCLYLRRKGVDSKNITELTRIGSEFEEYASAIRLLGKAGYLVLLTGDIDINNGMEREFGGMLFDSGRLNVDKDLFNIFAATESDIFIGESGGGVWLSVVNNLPILLVNAFPYGYGLPNSWVYYKTLKGIDGAPADYDRIFSNYIWKYTFGNFKLENNKSDEIWKAISSFITDISKPDDYDPCADIVSKMPDYAWIKEAKARLSPAWREVYG